MLFEEALQQILRLDAGVSAIVGSRIYPGFLPQRATYPAITYRPDHLNIARRLESPGDGISKQFVYVLSASYGITNYSQAAQLDAAVRSCLQGFAATVVSDSTSPAETFAIQGIFPTSFKDYNYDDVLQTHSIVSQFEINF